MALRELRLELARGKVAWRPLETGTYTCGGKYEETTLLPEENHRVSIGRLGHHCQQAWFVPRYAGSWFVVGDNIVNRKC